MTDREIIEELIDLTYGALVDQYDYDDLIDIMHEVKRILRKYKESNNDKNTKER